MKAIILALFVVLAGLYAVETEAATDKVVCYYGTWATYRNGRGKFDPEDIDPRLCTHLIYTFIGLKEDGHVRLLDEYNDLEENYGKGAINRFNRLRQLAPGVKTIIAIGGWNEGSIKYSNVMGNPSLRATFVQSALDFVLKYKFDGFDLDWEYPNQRGGKPEDVQNYIAVLRELHEAFQPHGLLLTSAVAAAKFSADQSYDIPAMSKYLNIINLMAYDLHGPWDKATGQNAPLYPSSIDESEIQKQLNVDACIKYWLNSGADPSKIVLGMGTYGRSFTLDNPQNTGLGSPAQNPGSAGPYTGQGGMLGYNEIVELQEKGGWTVVWDDEQKVPYMYKGNQWVGYDNPKSIALKTQYAKDMKLGGTMIWSIETDDFHGLSGSTYPLLVSINQVLGRDIDRPLSTPEPTSTTEPPTSTSQPIHPPNEGPAKYCKKEGYIRDPDNCATFYFCALTNGQFMAYEFHCQDGLVFDPEINACNYPDQVSCTTTFDHFWK